MTAPRRTPLGDQHTRTGLAARISRVSAEGEREQLVTTRGTDELLARAREAGGEVTGPDRATLSDVESLLREV
jgi:hypothetical protein